MSQVTYIKSRNLSGAMGNLLQICLITKIRHILDQDVIVYQLPLLFFDRRLAREGGTGAMAPP